MDVKSGLREYWFDIFIIIFFVALTAYNFYVKTNQACAVNNATDNFCSQYGFNYTDVRPEYYKCCNEKYMVIPPYNLTSRGEECATYWKVKQTVVNGSSYNKLTNVTVITYSNGTKIVIGGVNKNK